MTIQPTDEAAQTKADGDEDLGLPAAEPTKGHHRLLRLAQIQNLSLLYVAAGIVVLFAVWIPDTFLVTTTWKAVLNEQTITALVALGLLVPLCAGAFDLSIGALVGLSGILVAWLMVNKGISPVPAILITLVAGLVVGAVNGLLVVVWKIDSFIATLGSASLLTGFVGLVSGNQQLIGLPSGFDSIALTQVGGVVLPVFFMLLVAVILWYVLNQTPIGRRLYATGGGREAARLAGVRTNRIVFCSFLVSAELATVAGILLTASLTSASPDIGPDYLLPAFAAAFLGSTQIHPGRFNVWGTLLAVYVLAIGIKGLQLAGAASWVPDAFNGLALIIAVGLSGWRRRLRRPGGTDRAPDGRNAVQPASSRSTVKLGQGRVNGR